MNVKYHNIIQNLINEKAVLDLELKSLQKLLEYWDLQKDKIIGKRVILVNTCDQYTNVKPGEMGTVRYVDDAGTIFVDWDSGSGLGLIPGIDDFEMLI